MFQLFDEKRGRRYPLTGNTKEIGRSAQCDVCIPDDLQVSRTHARLLFDGTNWSIEDYESTNGILVNGKAVHKQILKPGDLIEIGNSMLRFLPLEIGKQFDEHKTNPNISTNYEEITTQEVDSGLLRVTTRPKPPKNKK